MIKSYLYFIIYGDFSEEDMTSMDFDLFKNKFSLNVECQNEDSIENALSLVNEDPLGSILRGSDQDLVDKTCTCKSAIVLSGTYQFNDIQAINELYKEITALFAHPNAVSLLDLLTLNIYNFHDWYKLQENIAMSQDLSQHVMIVVSPLPQQGNEAEQFWLHTRGMLKFGLPDLSIENIYEEYIENLYQILTFLINELIIKKQNIDMTLGVESKLEVPLCGQEKLVISAIFSGSEDDPEFNNYHLQLSA